MDKNLEVKKKLMKNEHAKRKKIRITKNNKKRKKITVKKIMEERKNFQRETKIKTHKKITCVRLGCN
jgi:hypothetical protein